MRVSESFQKSSFGFPTFLKLKVAAAAMPMPCYVPGCKSGYKSNGTPAIKRHFFAGPQDEDLRCLWNKNIRRIDKELTPRTFVCDLHFNEDDIIKVDEFIIEGKPVTLEKTRWKLRKGAIPVHFPTYPSYLNRPTKKRKPPKNREEPSIPSKRSKVAALKEPLEAEVRAACIDLVDVVFEEKFLEAPLTFEDLTENSAMISLPSLAWGCHIVANTDHLSGKSLCISEMENARFPVLKKAVLLKRDLQVEVWVGSNHCSNLQIDSLKRFADVGVIVSKIHEMCCCQGCPGFSDVLSCASGQLISEVWYSNDCHILLSHNEKETCSNCVQLRKRLFALRSRQQKLEATSILRRNPSTLTRDQLIGLLRMKNNDIKNLEKQVHRLSVTNLKKNFRNKTMKKEVLKLKCELRKAQLANKLQCGFSKSRQKRQSVALKEKQKTQTISSIPIFTVSSIPSCHYEDVITAVSLVEG